MLRSKWSEFDLEGRGHQGHDFKGLKSRGHNSHDLENDKPRHKLLHKLLNMDIKKYKRHFSHETVW